MTTSETQTFVGQVADGQSVCADPGTLGVLGAVHNARGAVPLRQDGRHRQTVRSRSEVDPCATRTTSLILAGGDSDQDYRDIGGALALRAPIP